MIKPATTLNVTADRARLILKCRVQTSNKVDMSVIVDGPEEGLCSVLPLREAIAMGVGYRW